MSRYGKAPWENKKMYLGKRLNLSLGVLCLLFVSLSGLLFHLNSPAHADSPSQDGVSVFTVQEEQAGDVQTIDSFQGDPNQVSPAAFADKVRNTTSMVEALHYLTASRWSAVPVPTSQTMEIDNQSSFAGPLESTTSQTIMTIATTIGNAILLLAAISFSNATVDVFVFAADRLVASFAGLPVIDFTPGNYGGGSILDLSNPGTGNTVVIISSLFTIALFTTGYRSLVTLTGRSMNQRIIAWGISMTKFVAILAFTIVVAVQSRANHEGGGAQQAPISRDVINTNQQTIGEVLSNPIEAQPVSSGSKTVAQPGSWKPLSMGWFISIIYYFTNMFTTAVTQLATALIKTPIDFVSSNASSLAYGNSVRSSCDRYVDSLHYAFSHTAASGGNSSASLVLLSIDKLYKEVIFNGYSIIYGGNTTSAQNSWCWALEVSNNSISPGEWALHSRNAGLYKEALGIGNLLDESNSNKVMSGAGMYPPIANLVDGPQRKDGLLITASGGWTVPEDDGGQVIRLSRYMGRESATGANQAKYYFAACEWPVDQSFGRLSYDWQGVRGMGETGGASESSTPVMREPFMVEDIEHEGISNVLNTWQGSDKWNETSEISFFLDDVDCQSPTLVPVGYGDEGEEKFGFGTSSVVAKRWEFTPLKDTLISSSATNVRDSVVSSGGLGGAIQRGLEIMSGSSVGSTTETNDDNLAKNPEIKFGSNLKENGTRPAYEFWKRANGTAGGDNQRIMGDITLTVIVLGAFIIMLLIPAFILNVILSFLFILVPAIMVGSLIMFIARGAAGKQG